MKSPESGKRFFDVEENVEGYIKMCEGMDGRELIEILRKHLPENSLLLELGMGPGIDLDILNETFNAVGSDYSQVFLDRYKKKNKDADLIMLDAVSLETDRKFDCVYSNKVLHHLKREDLPKSLNRQKELLKDGGLLFHSFWLGEGNEEYEGLRFNKYQPDELLEKTNSNYDLIETGVYAEMNKGDSFYLCLKRK